MKDIKNYYGIRNKKMISSYEIFNVKAYAG